MDGNVSRPANGGATPAPFIEAAMAGYGAKISPHSSPDTQRSAWQLGLRPAGPSPHIASGMEARGLI